MAGLKKKNQSGYFLHNEYLSCRSFVRGTGVVNAKSMHRLKEMTVQVQGRKIYEALLHRGAAPVLGVPWTRHGGRLGKCSGAATLPVHTLLPSCVSAALKNGIEYIFLYVLERKKDMG